MTYKLGSLFDGSGGFPLAGSLCGIVPAWASEVEPYPIAVTRSRFPSMKHLGDISKINGGEIEPVDIITFGSPCQDLSVAGKRAGLKHESNGDEETTRSGLFMEAVRIIKEMRRATDGRYPTFALWENVPGAFSSNKGEDFRVVIEELIKIVEPSCSVPPMPKGGWPYADAYMGDGWSLAYRVFDAQFWGVPQRRRRIHLVLDLRGERAREVLFEREGVRGYFATGRTPWQATAGDAQDCTGADDRAGAIPYTLKIRSGCEGGGKGALVQADKSATLATNNDQYLFQPITLEPGIAARYAEGFDMYNQQSTGDVSRTLKTPVGGDDLPVVCYSIGNHPVAVMASSAVNAETTDGSFSPCLMARAGTGGNQLPLVAIKTWDARGNGDGDTVNTITGDHENRVTDYTSVVAERIIVFSRQRSDELVKNDVVSTQSARRHKDATDLVVQPIAIDRAFFNQGQNALYDPQLYEDGTNPTLVARGPNAVAVRYIVRRLTPTECARLQGFADRWGDIDHKEDFTDEEYRFWLDVRNTHATVIGGKEAKDYTKDQMVTWYNRLLTDSSEYKMWGNGIALPPALYVMQGMEDALKGERNDESD